MHKQTYLGDNIVKELESEPTSRLVGDGDVKIGDGIGHGWTLKDVGPAEQQFGQVKVHFM